MHLVSLYSIAIGLTTTSLEWIKQVEIHLLKRLMLLNFVNM